MNNKDKKIYQIIYDKTYMKEIERIYLYIRNKLKEEKIASKIVTKIMGRLKILEQFPFAHKLIRKNKNFEYRKFIIKNYIIIYKISLKEKEVNILHIYNHKQKSKKQIEIKKNKIVNFVLI